MSQEIPRRPDGATTSVDPSRRHRRTWWGVTFLLVGTVWLLLALEVDVAWDLVLPIALVAIGALVLIVGHRTGDGLVDLGILVAIAALLVAFVPGGVDLSAGSRELRYTDSGDLPDEQGLGAGRLTIDLRDLDLDAGTTRFAAGVTFGELVVIVPQDVAVTGRGTLAIGEVAGFGQSAGGVGRTVQWDEPGARDGGPVLDLDLGAGFGRIEVRR
jgi:hypothetical protein